MDKKIIIFFGLLAVVVLIAFAGEIVGSNNGNRTNITGEYKIANATDKSNNVSENNTGCRGIDSVETINLTGEKIRIIHIGNLTYLRSAPSINSRKDITTYKQRGKKRLTNLSNSDPDKVVLAVITFRSPVSDEVLLDISNNGVNIGSIRYVSSPEGGGEHPWPFPEDKRMLWAQSRKDGVEWMRRRTTMGFKKREEEIIRRMRGENISSEMINKTVEYMEKREGDLGVYIEYKKGNKSTPPEIDKKRPHIKNASTNEYLNEIDEYFYGYLKDAKANIYNLNNSRLVDGYTVARVAGSAKNLSEVSKNPKVFLVDVGPVEYYEEYPDAVVRPSKHIYYEYKKYGQPDSEKP